LYKSENRREIKRAYKLVDKIKKDIKNLEQVLNGDEVYSPPSLNNDTLISYLSSVDPKKKGLYFQFNECRDITIIFKNQEIEHKHYIETYENKIDEIDKQIVSLNGNGEINKKQSLWKEKLDYKRKIDIHTRDLDDIYNDLDSYIIKSKHLENKIYEFQNALNASRVLSNNVEFSLSIIGPDHLSKEGQTLEEALNTLSRLESSSNKFKEFIEEYAIKKNSQTDNIYNKVSKTSKDSNGEEISTKILNKNKSVSDYSKSDMKAMRDTYFENLGY
jgi:hypothetical protein